MSKWSHVIDEVDNWIWIGIAALLIGIGAFFNVEALQALGTACLVKINAVPKKKD